MLRGTVVLLTAAGLASAGVTRGPAEEAAAVGRFFVGGPAVASIGTSAEPVDDAARQSLPES